MRRLFRVGHRAMAAIVPFGRWLSRWRGRGLVRALADVTDCFVALAAAQLLVRFRPGRAFAVPPVAPARAGNVEALLALFPRVAARHPLEPNCLHRSLALRALLAHRGVEGVLRIGLGKRPQLFPGHAWIEVDGIVVNDDSAVVGRYERLVVSDSALEVCYSR